MISRGKVIFVIMCAILMGIVVSIEAFHVFAVRNAPIVTGHIVARKPIKQYSVPRVDFTIQIEGTNTEVHAHAQGHLLHKVPDTVRFHYNGDPSREVFLFEYEENPYLVLLFCWGAALVLGLPIKSARVRRSLGWEN
jgi:hypothetical protein